MSDKNNPNVISVNKVVRTIASRRKLILRVLIITFILSCVWIFPEPRYYTSSVDLAPEMGGDLPSGGLSSIASSFGINLDGLQSNDAIYPILYPELFESPEFIVRLFDVQIQTSDGEIDTDYYTYLMKYQKKNVIKQPFKDAFRAVKRWIKPKKQSGHIDGTNGQRFDPFHLSEDDHMLMEIVKSNITCTVDKMTNVTTITVQDQDPLVSALMVDSVRVHLQNFIIDYRTSKARLDAEYYEQLLGNARQEYEDAAAAYSRYCETHTNVILQSYIQERDALENEMSLKYNTYSAMITQLDAVKAKVQERTPSFTILKSSTVPVKPAGPKRMLFVLGMLILAFFLTSVYILRDNILKPLKDD